MLYLQTTTSNVLLYLQDALPTNWPVQIMMTGGQPLTESITLTLGTRSSAMTAPLRGRLLPFAALRPIMPLPHPIVSTLP